MQITTQNGTHNVASKGLGGAALGLGIAGTAFGLLNNQGGGLLGGLFGGRNTGFDAAIPAMVSSIASNNQSCDTREIAAKDAEIAKLKSEKYTDQVGIEVYRAAMEASNKNDEKINANYKELAQFIAKLDKDIAVDKQATTDNINFLHNKIDCTKQELRSEYINADQRIYDYINGHFVAGKLVMPLDKLCPEAMRRYNTWVAPTTPAPDAE